MQVGESRSFEIGGGRVSAGLLEIRAFASLPPAQVEYDVGGLASPIHREVRREE